MKTETQKRAEQLLPIIQAAAAGKTIQLRRASGEWEDGTDLSFGRQDISDYRIKPERSIRSWRWDEVPVGAVIKEKGETLVKQLIVHSYVSGSIKTGCGNHYPFADVLENFVMLDGSPCGVTEEA